MSEQLAGDPSGSPIGTSWLELAACKGKTHVMFPPEGWAPTADERARYRRAQDLCAGCPVLDDCRAWVLSITPDPVGSGYCGGMSPMERRSARRGQRGARANGLDGWNHQAPFAQQLSMLDELIHGTPIPGLDRLLTGGG